MSRVTLFRAAPSHRLNRAFPNFSYGSVILFGLCLTFLSSRALQHPEYRPDGLLYMGNAVAMSGASIQVIHRSVYTEAKASIPAAAFNHLTGNDPQAPDAQDQSFRDRAENPYHFAEFLPCFAVRPIFTELIYVLHYGFGVSLLKSLILIPVVSYWLLGWVVLAWTSRYVATSWAVVISTLLLLSPPLRDMASNPSPDALSVLVLMLTLFLLLETDRLLLGTILLLASVYIRTDNIIIVGLALAYLWIQRRLRMSETLLLSCIALASVVLINHYAGDYGIKMLYYRGFIAPPVAVGEFTARFGLQDYLRALKTGIGGVLHGVHIPFVLIGVAAVLGRPSRAVVSLVVITFAAAAAHFIIFPLPETRYLASFFVAAGIALGAMASEAANMPLSATEQAISRPRQIEMRQEQTLIGA